jgi:hypothetical protein
MKLCKDKLLPRATKSSAERLEPSLLKPYTDRDEPNRQILRTDIELPRLAKSRQLRAEPNFDIPYTESPPPILVQDRIERLELMHT